MVQFRVGKEKGYQTEELGSLRNLKGRLEIRNLEMVRDKEEAIKANMFEKSNLSYLVFHWNEQREDESRSHVSVLEGLQPHENANLKVLKIEGFKGKRFPTWTQNFQQGLRSLNNLPELINCLAISSPRLTELTILGVPSFMVSPSVESSGLGSLKELKIDVSVEWSKENSGSWKDVATHLNLKGNAKLGVDTSIHSTSHCS